ncbi:hypothetical protein D3Z60_25385 [Lachnospiraceae bacterium]|nr:hypothetical protein [Lachnospiraceae bacterium]
MYNRKKEPEQETRRAECEMYRKDTGGVYRGGAGKGYAITPNTGGLTYIETPLLPQNIGECLAVLKELRDRGNPYGEGR